MTPAAETFLPSAALEGEVARLETLLFQRSVGPDVAHLEALIPRLEAYGDDALLGRALCMLARAEIALGQHAAALRNSALGVRAFSRLPAETTRRYASAYSEVHRAAGTALVKLGRVAEAFPSLEKAVKIAQSAIDGDAAAVPGDEFAAALEALIRGLVTLGVALFAIRQVDMAIQVYYRAIDVADAHPLAYECFSENVLLAFWNLTDALHERAIRLRAADNTEAAARDIEAAGRLLDPSSWKIAPADGSATPVLERLTPGSRDGYLSSMGRHLLITGQPAEARAMFERRLAENVHRAFVDDWGLADAHAGIAQAALDLGLPNEALTHTTLALTALDRHDESDTRATILLVRASAYRALNEFGAAFDALEEHHRIRSRLEAVAARQYAAHVTLQLGLERARADAESHRRLAATLETLGRVGQEITANLDADRVFAILQRHLVTLLHAPTFFVWLLDDAGSTLSLAFGIEDGQAVGAPDIPVNHPLSQAARAVRERKEMYSATPGSDGLSMLLPGTRPMLAALFDPLIVADRVLGVVSIQSDQSNAYSENERSIFRTLCAYAAIALDNAAAYRKLAQTIDVLRSTQSELALRTAEFERLSLTDPLTGVANRRSLDERAAVVVAEMTRKGGRLAGAMVDIDHFKAVNDTHGHAIGDTVLQ